MKQRLGNGPATLDKTIATISAKDIAKRALVAIVMCHWIVKGREGLANRPLPLRTSVLMGPRESLCRDFSWSNALPAPAPVPFFALRVAVPDMFRSKAPRAGRCHDEV